ncbi:phosphate/phosphite/phosphonate ABC transporter substrate-binding protein [Sphaerospermopsis aphanizomenoides BCCUSP55]|nr:phosphate/phosphite/phosphonate ABC transporter substrate-binding protein [Sphaerospermopsis aphanizomenoides BCCUSP55]
MKWLLGQQPHCLITTWLNFASLFCISAITIGCTPTTDDHASTITKSTSEPVVKKSLRVAVIPWQSVEEQKTKLQPLANYLQKTIKQPIIFQITKSYEDAVDLLATEQVDMGYLAPLTYIKCQERNPNIHPLVLPIDQITGRPWYTAVIVANSAQGIKSLKDLKGKRFGFVSPSSTSGFLMPMQAMKAQGIDPTRNFSGIRYSGSHDQAETDLVNGVVDAIADDKASFLRSQKAGKLPTTNYKIIWESYPIPTAPIVINVKKFSPAALSQLREALIDAPVGVVDVSGTKSAGYTLAKDADFEQIRQIYQQMKSVQIPAK